MKNNLAARAAAATRRPEPAADVEQLPPAAVPPRVRPVKMTVDLMPELYRQLKAFPEAMGLPEATGKARIPSVEIFRALLEELDINEDLRAAVANRVAANLER